MCLEPRICSGTWEVGLLGSQWLEVSFPTDSGANPVLLLLLYLLSDTGARRPSVRHAQVMNPKPDLGTQTRSPKPYLDGLFETYLLRITH